MEIHGNQRVNGEASKSPKRADGIDLVGSPFSVIESDPGVFTSLSRKLGIRNVSFVELYDISDFSSSLSSTGSSSDPFTTEQEPYGLILCMLLSNSDSQKESLASSSSSGFGADASSQKVWFANQLSMDSCATHALLNIVFNCQSIEIGEALKEFREDTMKMSPVMKGLAITNMPFIREAHNSLARPTDVRAALYTIARVALDSAAATKASKGRFKAKLTYNAPPPRSRKSVEEEEKPDLTEETYHFIAYVPFHGKVWELDGLRADGPLEVGEITDNVSWMDVARPALRHRMHSNENIRFTLLAILPGIYESLSDQWEYWKRERKSLEKRLDTLSPEWPSAVDPSLLEASLSAFTQISPDNFCSSASSSRTYARDFGSKRMDRDVKIMSKDSPDELLPDWERCVEEAQKAKIKVEEELEKGRAEWTDHIKRTHDYEPFLTSYIECMQKEGQLNPLLNLDENGRKVKASRKG